MPTELPIPDKADWQKLKNQYKVPSKLGKSSIGEHLDKIHKAAAISWFQTIVPCQQALVALKGYKDALKAKKDAALAKFVDVVDKQVEDKIEAHIKRVTSVRQQVLDAPKMAAKCGEALKAAQPLTEKIDALQKKVVIAQQLLSAVQTSVDILKKGGIAGEWDTIATFIRDTKKKLNDLDVHCEFQLKKPIDIKLFKAGWDKRATPAAAQCKSISDMFAAALK